MASEKERQLGVERALFLRSLGTVRPNGPEAEQLAAAMRDVYFKRGQQIFAQGHPSGDVFFVVKGSVRMTAPDSTPWDFDAPAVVGALDSFAGRPRTRTGVATSETHALALAHTDWLAVVEEHADFARESVLRLAAGVHRMHLGIAGDGGYRTATTPEGAPTTGLTLLERTLALRKLPVFQAAGVEATLRLVALASEVDLAPGETLFAEGDACDTVDVVTGGAIAVERSAPPLHAEFGAGSVVGGVGTIGVSRHAFGARAVAGAVLLRLRKDDVFDVMEDHFELVRAWLAAINVEREEIMQRHGVRDEGGPARR
jgi:CRP-like cAMP-binding protein